MQLSVIIPTYNRCKELADTLESIAVQQPGADTEIIVIDNGSNAQTPAVCKLFETRILHLRYLHNGEPGLLTGRHFGAAQATGQVLAFIDDDVILNPGYLRSVIALFSGDETIQLATGPCLPLYETPPPSWLPYFWVNVGGAPGYCASLSLLDLGDRRLTINPHFVFGLNFCIRKEVLFELRGFNPDIMPGELLMFQGDGETGLTLKIVHKQYKAVYDPLLGLHHQVSSERLTTGYFKKRAFSQGISDSFTQLRQEHHLSPSPEKTKEPVLRLKKLRQIYHAIRTFNSPKTEVPEDVARLRNEIREEQQKGVDYHRNLFCTDPVIKDWVLRKDYLDYHLPVGITKTS